MAARQTNPRSLTSIAGAFLLAVGFLILFSNLDAAAARIAYATGNTGGHVLEALPALVLALLHGLQAYVFDHAGFSSGVLQFLVSFWPLRFFCVTSSGGGSRPTSLELVLPMRRAPMRSEKRTVGPRTNRRSL